MPLLVGLLDSSHVQRGLDGSLSLSANGNGASEGDDIDLEELVSKSQRGGGMLDSIANMANSILGAGT
jgi:sodium-coupled neutral amino acid transporter 11